MWRLLGVLSFLGVVLLAQALPSNLFSKYGFPEDVRQADEKIISGSSAKEGDIPYQLSLRIVTATGSVSACGACLVHHRWALSAAHCTLGRRFLVIRFGSLDAATPELVLESVVWYDHPDYHSMFLNHDISIIDFGRHVHYTDNIKPIRIQKSHQTELSFENEVATASGFGLTSQPGNVSDTLNYVDLRIISNEECAETYGRSVIINSTICAVGIENIAQSTCSGDSGGPLAFKESDGLRTLIGVVSFVHTAGCATDNPSGYVRPGFYHDWFTEVSGIDFDALNESS